MLLYVAQIHNASFFPVKINTDTHILWNKVLNSDVWVWLLTLLSYPDSFDHFEMSSKYFQFQNLKIL